MNNKRDVKALKNIMLVDWHEDSSSDGHEKMFVVKFQIPAGSECSHSLYLRGSVRLVVNVKRHVVTICRLKYCDLNSFR